MNSFSCVLRKKSQLLSHNCAILLKSVRLVCYRSACDQSRKLLADSNVVANLELGNAWKSSSFPLLSLPFPYRLLPSPPFPSPAILSLPFPYIPSLFIPSFPLRFLPFFPLPCLPFLLPSNLVHFSFKI